MVAITPIFISALTTSPARAAIRAASSCTVIVSGSTTSRTTFRPSERSSSNSCWRRSRSRWRRTLASERVFSSSPSMAACTSMRPSRRPMTPFLATVAGTLRAGNAMPGRRRGASSSSGRVGFSRSVSSGVAGAAATGAGVATTGGGGAAAIAAASAAVGGVTGAADAAAFRAASSSAACFACSSAASRAAISAALAASSSRRRASSAADRMEIFSCSRRSVSRRAASRFCSSSTRWRVASSPAVSARPAPTPGRDGPAGGRGAPGLEGAVLGAVVWLGAGKGARFLRTST